MFFIALKLIRYRVDSFLFFLICQIVNPSGFNLYYSVDIDNKNGIYHDEIVNALECIK